MDNESITLPDGRKLGYRCLGDEKGSPLFFFHGTPGSRFVLSDVDSITKIPGIWWILPERPGYGISDPQPGRTILQWPDDVVELANFLGLDSFAVSGASGGGPHALACAARLPDRVTRVLLFSSPSPASFKGALRGMSIGNRIGFWIGKYAPWLLRRLIMSAAASVIKHPDQSMKSLASQLSASDKMILEDVEFRDALLRDMQEGYRQGGIGHAAEAAMILTSVDWGFSLRELLVPVQLWHGTADTLATVQMARHLEQEIPNCTATYILDAGHLLGEHPDVLAQVQRLFCD